MPLDRAQACARRSPYHGLSRSVPAAGLHYSGAQRAFRGALPPANGGGGGRPGQRVEEQGTWAAQKHREAGYGRPVDRSVWTAKTVKRPRQQPAHPQYANYWAPLTRKRHTMPHSAQPQHTNYWAPRTRKRHQQEHRPQRSTESSDPTQHAKGRTGDRPGPRKGATTRRNVTQGGSKWLHNPRRLGVRTLEERWSEGLGRPSPLVRGPVADPDPRARPLAGGENLLRQGAHVTSVPARPPLLLLLGPRAACPWASAPRPRPALPLTR